MKRCILSHVYLLQFFLSLSQKNTYTRVQLLCAKKKWYFARLLFFTDSLMRWTFFPLSLPLSLSLSHILLLLHRRPILIHAISEKKKNERKSQWLHYEELYTHTHARVADKEEKNEWPDSCASYVCPQSFLYTFRNDEKSTEGNSLLIYSFEHRWFSY